MAQDKWPYIHLRVDSVLFKYLKRRAHEEDRTINAQTVRFIKSAIVAEGGKIVEQKQGAE